MSETRTIKKGDQAPDFVITASNGDDVTLSDFLGGPLVLFFYAKNDSRDCVRLVSEFRDHYSEFIEHGAQVAGVAIEKLGSHSKFVSKYKIPFLLLCDKDMYLSKLYGVFGPRDLNGATVLGIARTTLIINPKGEIVKIFNNVNPKGHAKRVLEYLKKTFSSD